MNLVKQIIVSSKLTQRDFAEKVGEDPATISKYVNGGRKISLDKFVNWCDIFNIEIKLLKLPTFSKSLNDMILTIEDITNWNGTTRGSYTFSIININESKYNEDDAYFMESFLTDVKSIYADQFNIEYMSHLTGEVKCTKEELIDSLNEYFKTSHL